MTDTTDVNESAKKLAEKSADRDRLAAADALTIWIYERSPANAHILQQLEGDLRKNQRLNEWGQFALEDLLRPPRRDPRRFVAHRIAAVITFFRNLLLFVPVAITWYAIERAAVAYSGQLKLQVETTFLQVWLDDADLTLATTAKIDAGLIGLLIVFTLLAQFMEVVADRSARRADERDERDFQSVLVSVGLFLHGFRSITPSALKSGLAEAVDNLRKSSEQLAAVSEKATDTLTQFAQVSVNQLEPAVRRIDGIVAALGGAAASHEQMTKLVSGLQAHLGESLSMLTVRIDDLGGKLKESLSDNNGLLEKSLRGLTQEMLDVARNLNQVAATAREVALMYRERV
jgi:prefoldin subunit 5